MCGYPNVGSHAAGTTSFFYDAVNHCACQRLGVLTQKDVIRDDAIGEIGFADGQIFDKPFAQQWGFGDNSLFVALASDDDVIILDLFLCQTC